MHVRKDILNNVRATYHVYKNSPQMKITWLFCDRKDVTKTLQEPLHRHSLRLVMYTITVTSLIGHILTVKVENSLRISLLQPSRCLGEVDEQWRLLLKHKVWQYGSMFLHAGRTHHESKMRGLCSKCHDAYLWLQQSVSFCISTERPLLRLRHFCLHHMTSKKI